ncbi:SDR family oxidoreductase [Stutzerimonas tarimensis]|uniref:SDR family oxidoreductase n=1 Tax=Stutzerimonas tarimensis TaxID=1507735 RepID=A0ABV7T7G0_9GAMM
MTDIAPTVVVTGGTAGVGRASALAFARQGYRVAVIARGQQGLDDTCAELEAIGVKALGIAADVADADAVEQAAERIEDELGPIAVWVNSAMATVFGPTGTLTAEEYKRVTEVTYLGSVNGTQSALRRMKPRDSGTIVQVGSALSYRAIPLQSAYCAAKFAIRGFTDSLRCELIHDNSRVRLTMVQLPAHNTPQFDWSRNKMGRRAQPVPPIHTPEVAARAIVRAAREAPRELWLGKASFQAILGNMLMPGLLDRMMAEQAWDGQMTDEPVADGRPDNLHEPVEELHATSGRFAAQAQESALGLSSETVGKLAVGGLAIAAVAAVSLVAGVTAGLNRRLR